MKFKAKILLIEDNKNISLVEKICLEANEFEVVLAEDGIRGLEMAINERPDLILLDIIIPKMNGYLVLEALQNHNAGYNIPVLVTSAKAQVDDLKHALDYKIQGYLVKPFTSQQLLAKIHDILKL
ncbi:MAG TPA: response regulator [Firmicutes bacterium]|jgi:DNA-binding response OmpR family regulator|nr:response regulator [Bacillota bacterium]